MAATGTGAMCVGPSRGIESNSLADEMAVVVVVWGGGTYDDDDDDNDGAGGAGEGRGEPP